MRVASSVHPPRQVSERKFKAVDEKSSRHEQQRTVILNILMHFLLSTIMMLFGIKNIFVQKSDVKRIVLTLPYKSCKLSQENDLSMLLVFSFYYKKL